VLTIPREVPEMDIFDYTSLCTVKDMAAGMTKEEILETFNIKEDDLSKTEQIYFDEFYAFGKGMAVNTVIQNFIESTRGRQGQAAAMSFLKRFAKNFEGEIEGDSSGSFSFSFGKTDAN
jgi:hypothetical protein